MSGRLESHHVLNRAVEAGDTAVLACSFASLLLRLVACLLLRSCNTTISV